MRYLTIFFIVLLFLAACTSEPASPAETATPTRQPATATPQATSTPAPSPTVVPASTPNPTPTFSPGRVILPTPAPRTPTPTPASRLESLEETLERIAGRTALLRNLFSTKPIEKQFITSDELRIMLQEDLKEELEDILESQALLVTLGVLDEEVNYLDLLVGVYGETVLGFFDTEEAKMFLIENNEDFASDDVLTYAHEYVHGLQQQHFDIRAIQKSLKGNADRSLAFQGITEGDATLVQRLYLNQYFGEEEFAELREAANNVNSALFDSSPHVLQRLISFPYREGPAFVLSALITGGSTWGIVDDLYANPPRSTEQILHPEKYSLVEDEPKTIVLPDIKSVLGDEWTEFSMDTFGEFFLSAYLETWTGFTQAEFIAAASAAAGWGGDSYILLKGPDNRNLLVTSIKWDTEEDAQEFFDFFSQSMVNRTDLAWEPEGKGATSQVMNLENQSIYIELDATNTLLIYAPNTTILESAKSAFTESQN